jgi:hypothetical protein
MDTNSSFSNISICPGSARLFFLASNYNRSGALRHLKPEIWNLTCPELASEPAPNSLRGKLKTETWNLEPETSYSTTNFTIRLPFSVLALAKK